MNVTLTVQAGPHAGQIFTFNQHDTFMVGRGDEVHFRLPEDRALSRKHFLLEVNPPLCRLQDLNSRSGTKVNGRKTANADLYNGDLIQAGETVFLLTVESELENDPNATIDLPQQEDALAHAQRTAPFPRIPGYEIRREIAEGGMGIVYEAVRKRDGSQVAVKTLLPTAAPTKLAIERFLREARILETLDHPHIVRFLEMGEVQRLIWFAMEFVPGTDASQHIRAHGPMAVGEAIRLSGQLLEALQYAHAKRFVHRDIKPANTLLTQIDGKFAAKLSDFGLARTYQASQLSGLTVTGSYGGTLMFMSPEQVRSFRDVKPPADQYSAAATIYYLLTGKPVFDADSKEVASLIGQILDGKPVPIRDRRPDLNEDLAHVIQKALSKDPDDRYPDVETFWHALRPFAAS